MATKDDILLDALKLPAPQRGEVARALLLSLDDEVLEAPDSAERAWGPEVRKRLDDVLTGREETDASDDVHSEIEALIVRLRRR